MSFVAGSFHIATLLGPRLERGYLHAGLGLHMVIRPSPKGRRPAHWSLSHLGSGHRICGLNGTLEEVLPITEAIAAIGVWEEFVGVYGWHNVDPELGRKINALKRLHPRRMEVTGGAPVPGVAAAVAKLANV